MYKPKHLIVLFSLLFFFRNAQSQAHMLFEAGATYFTNNIDKPETRLYDFLAFTINPRVLLMQGSNTSVALDFPFSIRSKSSDDRNIRFGVLVPALVVFNFGAGANDQPNKSFLGFTAGAGWAYFHQRTQSEVNESPQYKESFSSSGPMIQAGIRIPHRKLKFFQYKNTDGYAVSAIKFNYLVNLDNDRKSIGSVSLLMGLGF
jgi:hypothetical protein